MEMDADTAIMLIADMSYGQLDWFAPENIHEGDESLIRLSAAARIVIATCKDEGGRAAAYLLEKAQRILSAEEVLKHEYYYAFWYIESALLGEIVELLPYIPRPIPLPSKNPRPGFVYVAWSGSGPVYKIGMTGNLKQRMKGLKHQFPSIEGYDIVIHSTDMWFLEKTLHAKYHENRIENEWFVLTDQDIDDIRSIGDKS